MKKKVTFLTGFSFIPVILFAQSHLPTVNPDKLTKKSFMAASKLMTFRQMDQRKIYHWATGERSTPTGRQAGEPTSGYVRVFEDSAVVVANPYLKKKK